MRSPTVLSTLVLAFSLVSLTGCTASRDVSAPENWAESDQAHEVDHEYDHELPVDLPTDATAAAVATAFAAAFADTSSGDATVWQAGLAQHCYREYCDLLVGVDLAEIPAGAAPTGAAVVAPGQDETSRTATVPAAGGVWTVSLFVGTSGAWLVTDCRWSPT